MKVKISRGYRNSVIFRLSMLIIALLCLSAKAVELTEYTDVDKKMLARALYGNLADFNAIAKVIVSGRVKNEAVLDVFAERVYQQHASLKGAEFDTYAWMVRAISKAENDRHRMLLKKVQKKAKNQTLVRYLRKTIHTLQGLPEVEQYIAGSMDIESLKVELYTFRPLPPKTPRNDLSEAELMQFHIANSDLFEIKTIAKNTYRGLIREQRTLDTLAEFLHQHYEAVEEPQLDTLAWICKSFKSSNDQRYLPILRRVVAMPDLPNKLKKHCRGALRKVQKKEASEVYKFGSINLDVVLEQYRASPQ